MTIDVLAIGPHPDDVEMTCGGLLLKLKARGYSTGILHLTRGEMGSRGTPEEREKEAGAAAEILGVDHMEMLGERHGFADGRVRASEEAKRTLAAALRRLTPRLVIAPFPRDPHPDHANAGRIAAEAAHFAELKKSDIAGEPHFVGQIVYAMYRANFEPTFIADITDEFETKKQAVLAYHSQVGGAKPGEAETRLSSPLFMQGWEARAQHFGWIIGRPYGEPYFCEYAVPLDDPVAAFEIPQQRRIVMRPIGG